MACPQELALARRLLSGAGEKRVRVQGHVVMGAGAKQVAARRPPACFVTVRRDARVARLRTTVVGCPDGGVDSRPVADVAAMDLLVILVRHLRLLVARVVRDVEDLRQLIHDVSHGVHLHQDLAAVVQDGQHVQRAGLALEADHALEELLEGHVAVAVIEQVEERLDLVRLELHVVEKRHVLWVIHELGEFLPRDHAVHGRVGGYEDLPHLHRERLRLLVLQLHHHLGVGGRDGQRLLQEECRDDTDDREDHASDIQREEAGVPRRDVLDERPHPSRPAAAEGDLEHGPQCLGGGAVVRVAPQAMLHCLAVVADELLEGLAHEEGGHEHEGAEDKHGPEEAHEAGEDGTDEHAQLVAELHGADETQGPHQLHVAEDAHEAQVPC
mmetsp:Transcript_29060/g.73816  ORF Transcript_29060/g.73816 Transcript_29060/m.73816 type:complete len:384 (-) Transcript_29060:804-1955(-)